MVRQLRVTLKAAQIMFKIVIRETKISFPNALKRTKEIEIWIFPNIKPVSGS